MAGGAAQIGEVPVTCACGTTLMFPIYIGAGEPGADGTLQVPLYTVPPAEMQAHLEHDGIVEDEP